MFVRLFVCTRTDTETPFRTCCVALSSHAHYIKTKEAREARKKFGELSFRVMVAIRRKEGYKFRDTNMDEEDASNNNNKF